MPLYEFQCTDCGEHMELIVKVNARTPKCPDCGGKLQKQISAPAFQFKGSGWYITDYSDKGKTSEPSKKGDSKDSSDGGSKSSDGDSSKSGGSGDSGSKKKSKKSGGD